MLAKALFDRLITTGRLTVEDARGRRHVFDGNTSGPHVRIRLHDPSLHHRLALRPRLAFGEAYMDGTLTVEDGGSIYDLLGLLIRSQQAADLGWMSPLGRGLGTLARPLAQRNWTRRARRNVAHHYDLSGELYRLFLDDDRQYSCAYFRSPESTLEEAQLDKKHHLAAKLDLRPGQTLLDIGAGWGGLALYMAERFDVTATGITLSSEQLAVARERAEKHGISGRLRFELKDYREIEGPFDRIVSVGMFEHVGAPFYDVFFRKVRDLLSEDGVMVLHSIGRLDPPGDTNPWIQKYIFPGGYVPALSETLAAVERAGLFVTDIEILRLHYAETLNEWRRRFLANRDKIEALYDQRFCRMWEFYLAASEVGFRYDGLMVFQLQLTRDITTLPITREYMVDREREISEPGASAAA